MVRIISQVGILFGGILAALIPIVVAVQFDLVSTSPSSGRLYLLLIPAGLPLMGLWYQLFNHTGWMDDEHGDLNWITDEGDLRSACQGLVFLFTLFCVFVPMAIGESYFDVIGLIIGALVGVAAFPPLLGLLNYFGWVASEKGLFASWTNEDALNNLKFVVRLVTLLVGASILAAPELSEIYSGSDKFWELLGSAAARIGVAFVVGGIASTIASSGSAKFAVFNVVSLIAGAAMYYYF